MSEIHFVAQGKGGVGKSVISALITQKFLSDGKTVKAFDTDPVNATFTNYKALNVQFIEIMEDSEINPRKFDALMELLFALEEDVAVIDNGASSFIPLSAYLESNAAINMLIAHGHTVHIHTIVTGGQGMKDTLAGLAQVVNTFGDTDAKICVWQNEFWGKVEQDGKQFEDMKVFKANAEKISSVITIPELKPRQLFQDDFSAMLKQRLTFDEAIDSDSFDTMTRSRLKIIKTKLFTAMEEAI